MCKCKEPIIIIIFWVVLTCVAFLEQGVGSWIESIHCCDPSASCFHSIDCNYGLLFLHHQFITLRDYLRWRDGQSTMAWPNLVLKCIMETYERDALEKRALLRIKGFWLPTMKRRAIQYGLTRTSVEMYDGNLRGRWSWEASIDSDEGFLIASWLPKMKRRVIHYSLTQKNVGRYDGKVSWLLLLYLGARNRNGAMPIDNRLITLWGTQDEETADPLWFNPN